MMMHREAVVVTGMGFITSLGRGVEENWAGVKACKTGIACHAGEELPAFLRYLGKVGGLAPDGGISHKLLGQMKFLNRGSQLGFAASREAVAMSGSDLGIVDPGRRALYIAAGDTTSVGYDFMYPATKDATAGRWRTLDFGKLVRSTIDKVNPFFLLESINNNLFSFLSAFFQFMGPNTSLASHSPSGGNAIELAVRSIAEGAADIALVVGCGNWVTEVPLLEMQGLGVLSKCRDGERSYRPYDRRRDGFIPGEGGAALFLESATLAGSRGARVYGRVRGLGNAIEFSGDTSITVPAAVSARSMALALDDASCGVTDLAFICPHGSGSQKGDRSELTAVKELCGAGSPTMAICGLKPYTGHLGAASDVGEIILCLKALTEHMVPATPNFSETEQEFSRLRIADTHQICDGDKFLSVSYGIGGESSSIIVEAAR